MFLYLRDSASYRQGRRHTTFPWWNSDDVGLEPVLGVGVALGLKTRGLSSADPKPADPPPRMLCQVGILMLRGRIEHCWNQRGSSSSSDGLSIFCGGGRNLVHLWRLRLAIRRWGLVSSGTVSSKMTYLLANKAGLNICWRWADRWRYFGFGLVWALWLINGELVGCLKNLSQLDTAFPVVGYLIGAVAYRWFD